MNHIRGDEKQIEGTLLDTARKRGRRGCFAFVVMIVLNGGEIRGSAQHY